jgi:hemolysin D
MSLAHRIAAHLDLAGRYRAAFAHYWRHRRELAGKALAEHEAEFLPAALALQARPVSPAARWVAFTLILLVFALVAWAVFGKIDIIVNATGKVIPGGYTKTIASVDVASVRALYVEEGQAVKAGDVLVELDTSASDAERDKAAGDRVAALLQVARAGALIAAIDKGRPPKLAKPDGVPEGKWQDGRLHLEGEYRDYRAKLQRIEGDIARYGSTLPLAARRAKDYKALLAGHDVAYHDWLEKEQARADLAGQLADAQNQRAALVAETRKLAYDQLAEGNRAAASAGQDALRSDAHSKLLRLAAPVDGTVQQLAVHTVGGVVAAATPLMQIVPERTQVEVEAFLENKDIGFVQEGQPAEVKVDAFEYTKYGTIPGRVSHVSRDAIDDEKKGLIYSGKVVLSRKSINVEGKELPLSAGMTVNVEIKTGDRRIIEYVLSPLLRHKRESLNER